MSMSRIIDLSIVALMLVVFGLRMAGSPEAAIGIGVFVPWVIGLVIFGIAIVSSVLNRGHGDGQKDFSSFSPAEERAFVGHEQLMRNNSKRAAFVGFGIGGALFLAATGIVFACYTPCSKYCERPPSACKTDAQIATFKANCESSCGTLEKQHGQTFVETLTACAFSNSVSGGCEAPTQAAISSGLWCEEK